MKTKIISTTFIVFIATIATINTYSNLSKEKEALSELALANLNALANSENITNPESEHQQTIYVRKTSDCWIYGNGKISIMGGNIIEVNGSLCLADYQVSCSSGGTSTCKNIECAEIWGWIK